MPNVVLGKREGKSKNGRFVEYEYLAGKRPFFVKNHWQSPVPKSAKSLAVALVRGV